MIHSHWLCYKYFYGSVFLFLFPSPFSKKAAWISTASRTHIIAPKNHRMLQLEESLRVCWSSFRSILQVRQLESQRDEDTFWRSQGQCLAGSALDSWSLDPNDPRTFQHTLSFSSVGKGSALDRALLPTVRPPPQAVYSQQTWRMSLPRAHWYFWSLL